jgi:hypothetical protein
MDDYVINKIIDYSQPILYHCELNFDYISNRITVVIPEHSEKKAKITFLQIIENDKDNLMKNINKVYKNYIQKYYWEYNFIRFQNLKEFDDYILDNIEIKIYDPTLEIINQLKIMN